MQMSKLLLRDRRRPIFEWPINFVLGINLKSAKALGPTEPQSLRVTDDQVV
jgi:hypothetical protein